MIVRDVKTKKEINDELFIKTAAFHKYDAENTIKNLEIIGFEIVLKAGEKLSEEVDEYIGLRTYYDSGFEKGIEYVHYLLIPRE